jgi:hypothetical protein
MDPKRIALVVIVNAFRVGVKKSCANASVHQTFNVVYIGSDNGF